MTLRLLRACDGEALVAAVEPARADLCRWFEWPDRVTTIVGAANYISETQRQGRIRLWWLIYKGDQPVGGIQMRLRDGGEAVSLPYWLIPEARGRGLATRAVADALMRCKVLGFKRAKFIIAKTNGPSQALAYRLGLRVTGNTTTVVRGREDDALVYELALCTKPSSDTDSPARLHSFS